MAVRRRGLSPLFAILIIIFVALLCFASSFFILSNQKKDLAKYEENLPESAISSYLKQIKNNDFDVIYENSLVIDPHFNSKQDYVDTLKNIYQDIDINKITFIKDEENDTLYKLVSDNKLIANLKLIKDTNSKYMASTIFAGDNNFTFEMTPNIQLTINGIELDDSYMKSFGVVASNFEGVSDRQVLHINRFEIKNLISFPEIKANIENFAIIKDVVKGVYYVGEKGSEDLKDYFVKAASAIAKYPTKDGTLNTIGQQAITTSDFYKRISTLDNQWYAAHGTAQIYNVNVSDIVIQNEYSMIGNVTLDFLVASSKASKTYHVGYQISFLKDNGTWKIAGLGIDNSLNPLYVE